MNWRSQGVSGVGTCLSLVQFFFILSGILYLCRQKQCLPLDLIYGQVEENNAEKKVSPD